MKILLLTFLLNLFLLNANQNEKIDLTDKTLKIRIIDSNINILKNKTKEDYIKKSNLLEPEYKQKEKTLIKKEATIKFDGDVDIDKTTKSIDGVKLNLGIKF
jgi:hypothetical protein